MAALRISHRERVGPAKDKYNLKFLAKLRGLRGTDPFAAKEASFCRW
jgi:hypothetical protein